MSRDFRIQTLLTQVNSLNVCAEAQNNQWLLPHTRMITMYQKGMRYYHRISISYFCLLNFRRSEIVLSLRSFVSHTARGGGGFYKETIYKNG